MAADEAESALCSGKSSQSLLQSSQEEGISQESPRFSSATTSGSKPKKPPSITPRRFSRFWNPTSSQEGSVSSSPLCDITFNGANRRSLPVPLPLSFDDLPALRPSKRRRRSLDIYDENASETSTDDCVRTAESAGRSAPCQPVDIGRVEYRPRKYCAPIRKALRYHERPRISWQSQVADFHSAPTDYHDFDRTALPYCTAACNTNTLVAIGDEEGYVRLLESSEDARPPFNTPYVMFRPHKSAVMDLAFSSDDRLLATASGDQTASIVDMRTQTPISVLAKHTSSVKQVAFQPGNNDMVATCSRDSVVGLWDLRCSERQAQALSMCHDSGMEINYPHMHKSIIGGHRVEYTGVPLNLRGKVLYPSITALKFIPNRPHLFLTASGTSAHIKVWDVRGRYSLRSPPEPVSTSSTLPNHENNRHFGINSLCFSTDGSRLYSVCKDSTVYVYSASHLVLGSAPELSRHPPRWRKGEKKGLGPLYGLRHPAFSTASFYVRAALRTATGRHSELLAVGSSEACPVLFPSDERNLASHPQVVLDSSSPVWPTLTAASGSTAKHYLPIYTAGTPLIRGHTKEVTSLCWTYQGELVTVGDDFQARVWREGHGGDSPNSSLNAARAIRMGGEGEGRRHRCGWAEMGEEWDEDDG